MPDSTLVPAAAPAWTRTEPSVSHGDRALAVLSWAAAGTVALAFACILADLIRHGSSRLSWTFLVTAPASSGRAGGIDSILVSTLLILAVCLAVSVPLGIGTAALLSEAVSAGSRFGSAVRRSLDVLAGVPSIVFGLFGSAFFCVGLGLGFSILAGGLTLACMVLPILVRASGEALRQVPPEYRSAAAALALSRTGTFFRLVLPAAVPGITVGLVLGIGRALAETAALLFTSGYVDRMPGGVMDSGRALSVHIYDLSMNIPGGEPAAYGSALVLLALLATINAAASFLAHRYLRRRILSP